MEYVIPFLIALIAVPIIVTFAQAILVMLLGVIFFSINLVVLTILWALGVTRKRNY